MSITMFRVMQEELRQAWKTQTSQDLKMLWLPRGADEMDVYYMPLTWRMGRLALRPSDVWTFMRLLMVRDVSEGIARICANVERCKHPFYVGRKNQKNCSTECRNALGQTNFQKRRRHGE